MEEIINEVWFLSRTEKINPCGTFDYCRRWEPNKLFKRHMGCVRKPTGNWPFSKLIHCRTRKFITKLLTFYNVKTLEQALTIYTKGKI